MTPKVHTYHNTVTMKELATLHSHIHSGGGSLVLRLSPQKTGGGESLVTFA